MVMGDVDLSGMGNEGGRKSQGKGINMNPDGFIMAYEAVHKELNATARDEWMATIIGAARHKRMRIGESSSTLDRLWHIEGNEYPAGGADQEVQPSDDQETQHSSGPSNLEVASMEKSQHIMPEETTERGAVQRVQPLMELDSVIARNMEVISHDNTPAGTEQFRADSQMDENPSNIYVEENEHPACADADAGINVVDKQSSYGNRRVSDVTGEPGLNMMQPLDRWADFGDIPKEMDNYDFGRFFDDVPEPDHDDN
ncbi:hypothetical protein FXO37_22050 [Capsicum annuum]|nr:hypothetical protein FXO37_22050 [Capsicum annuum]